MQVKMKDFLINSETLTILDVYNLFGRNSNEFQFFVKKYNENLSKSKKSFISYFDFYLTVKAELDDNKKKECLRWFIDTWDNSRGKRFLIYNLQQYLLSHSNY